VLLHPPQQAAVVREPLLSSRIKQSARIESFVLQMLVRTAAIDAVVTALGQNGPTARPPRPARPPAAAPATKATAGNLAFKRRKGGKRSPEQLAKIDDAIVSFVKASPGQGVEAMGKALGVPTNDLKLRVLGLVGSKKIKKTGVKRATKYFAA
jgi:hypothetical protein